MIREGGEVAGELAALAIAVAVVLLLEVQLLAFSKTLQHPSPNTIGIDSLEGYTNRIGQGPGPSRSAHAASLSDLTLLAIAPGSMNRDGPVLRALISLLSGRCDSTRIVSRLGLRLRPDLDLQRQMPKWVVRKSTRRPSAAA
jgi:hypothetical protein